MPEIQIFTYETVAGQVYRKMDDLAARYGIAKRTVQNRICEMHEEDRKSGRYKDRATINDGKIVLVNELAFLDWLKYRGQLQEKNARKYTPRFDPAAWMETLGYSRTPIREVIA